MLVSERESQEKHLLDLGRRLRETQQERATAHHSVSDLQVKLREALRKQGETEQQAALQQRALEDERTRQELALRLAAEKTAAEKIMVRQQGKQVHNLEEKLRAQENEVARLQIEKDGTSGLILSFQGCVGIELCGVELRAGVESCW